MSYRIGVFASAALFAILAIALLTAPALILFLFGLESNAEATVMSNRAAALFSGLFALAWLGRNVQNSETQILVLRTLSVTMAALILVGTYHLLSGQVGPGIMLALGGEAAFLVSYIYILRMI